MPGKFESPRSGSNKKPVRRRRRRFNPLFLVPVAILLVAVVLVCTMCGKGKESKQEDTPQPSGTTALPTESIPQVVASATVSSQGDLLMHRQIFFAGSANTPQGACNLGEGAYNFDTIFQYISPYVSDADYGVINLETTFGGEDYPYQGNPNFNCPDALADSAVKAGYDMLLTANNHCCDTTVSGIKRTLEQVHARNLATLGTQMNSEEKKYTVVDVNGIQLGMLCYTYAGGLDGDGVPNLNLNQATRVTEDGIVNYFTTDNLDKLYREVEGILQAMKQDGAEATILYIHWGEEYKLTSNSTQQTIAQKMCDLGIDVIVGGHPHVMQPVELLTSTADPSHKSVCIYSLGNAVSNQRTEEMQNSCPTGHTEDGAVFTVTFEKNSDGDVYLAGVELLPTWVNKFINEDGKTEYNIVPLDKTKEKQWKTLYHLTDDSVAKAKSSYDRTMTIVNPGLTQVWDYLGQRAAAPEPTAETQETLPQAA